MNQLEIYMNTEDGLHPLIKTALVHSQFEAIHPFWDGNGRVGRLLITLMLNRSGILTQPWLYPSSFLENNREQYYDLLFGISARGEWTAWLRYYLEGMRQQAESALEQLARIRNTQEHYRAQLQKPNVPAVVLKVVDQLFSQPVLTIARVVELLQVSEASAGRYVRLLADEGIIVELESRKKNKRFVAAELLRLIEGPG